MHINRIIFFFFLRSGMIPRQLIVRRKLILKVKVRSGNQVNNNEAFLPQAPSHHRLTRFPDKQLVYDRRLRRHKPTR